ncbi:NADH-quinone oxidoreductase subunit J [Paraburkholderia domus]|jgi:NADH-quinone oxidoreductase subunit J|uniref:NADH-quinone oxidoreductase subunit J n=1 Tax=Paraburkholderia domus TaxID=2793075 RepID=A0A9N8R0S1_9BURK|nr:NADH-quinone oxidoreductase subunit J [Paraburkholderia domus]MBK5059986.1 NADH-quinone oxidoreductase subunit J [Burkholderia sp. R-70199]MBK5087422.1 NADH-quinone oxidoreductase subunit J [Burkholderia sp. R-69927]MBK5121573.1 NADH-quinone oxidoreductase subunit J [Burkholderia sp. R-69980]MBK5167449.1 NADH-quinone oxidoreductase subunit J [Burkholderia sp. R-70211]MBK5181150.1 NADH-quinone oxidoreductase subunit J [Burkholderia sp. R-69749]MCI0146009.1 NADH-quinone oxidoreductase subuni
MEFTTVLFYIFALLLVVSGLKVITSRNPVSSALFLVLAFFNAAAIWMLLEAEFLAILLVLVYVGAVMVLFLFVVMMLDINIDVLRKDFKRFVPMATLVGAIIVIETALILWHGYGATATALRDTAAANGMAGWSNTRVIGKIIYTDYIFAFEVAGLVLLVAIIAAIALTTSHKKDSKRQNISEQVKVRAQDRVRIVKMASEKTAATVAAEEAAAAAAAADSAPAKNS